MDALRSVSVFVFSLGETKTLTAFGPACLHLAKARLSVFFETIPDPADYDIFITFGRRPGQTTSCESLWPGNKDVSAGAWDCYLFLTGLWPGSWRYLC